jgi:hypothetical protein
MPNYELVILRPDEMCLKKFLSYIVGQEQTAPGGVSKEYCQDLISVMDTEWDRRVFRVFAAMGRTNEEFSALGFKSDLRKADKEKVEGLVGDMKDIEIEAEKMVMDGLESKKKRVEEKVKEHTRIVNEKQHKWTEIQLSERKEAIEDLQEEIAKTELFIARDEKTKKALERMFRRKKNFLIDARRIKKRKQNAGRKRMMTDEDERYLAKSIAEKSTAHGRRHDTVLYLNHRVKKKHLLKIVNHRRAQNSLPLLKSVTTVYNCSRPKNKRSRQAKNHIGLGLFCCKQSPKSEEDSNILVHYCRSRKKNVSLQQCKKNKDKTLFRSFDDKSQLCPGTKTGVDSTSTGILQSFTFNFE